MPPRSDAAGSFQARLVPTDTGLTVDRFVDLGPTPGNVGICLSGGGSRALTAGMGQLRALLHLRTPDGKSLLGQARALSTVSGGSWVGVPFIYLRAGTSDDDYLGTYVPDPGRLVPTKTAGHSSAETLDELSPRNAGHAVANPLFGPVPLTFQVLLLHAIAKVPTPFLWQTAVALNVLRRYGLFEADADLVPTSLFTYDAASLATIREHNPALAGTKADLVADAADPTRARRPFLVCNCAMFLREPGTDFESLAPVQATAFMTGIVGRPEGTDANGRPVGGGGVSSFAFSSNPEAVDGEGVAVEQQRQLALLDIVGTSSAFFAGVLQNTIATWRQHPDAMAADLEEHMDGLLDWVGKHMPSTRSRTFSLLDRLTLGIMKASRWLRGWLLHELGEALEEVQDLIPEYAYWPVRDAAATAATRPTRFADGGDLENTGVASLLAYTDIEKVVACVNSSTPLAAGAKGVVDAQGQEVPGTRVVVASQLAPLFGYQAYDPERGYVLYAGDAPNPQNAPYRHNQVFEPTAFADFLRQIWRVTGNTGDPAELGARGRETQRGLDLEPAIVKQRLKVLPNAWFGVTGKDKNGRDGREVTVVWVYNNRVRRWYEALRQDVRAELGPFDKLTKGFPNVGTLDTHLPTTQVNLLASLTAWSIANPENAATFVELFRDESAG